MCNQAKPVSTLLKDKGGDFLYFVIVNKSPNKKQSKQWIASIHCNAEIPKSCPQAQIISSG